MLIVVIEEQEPIHLAPEVSVDAAFYDKFSEKRRPTVMSLRAAILRGP